jgi:hypothetical protein
MKKIFLIFVIILFLKVEYTSSFTYFNTHEGDSLKVWISNTPRTIKDSVVLKLHNISNYTLIVNSELKYSLYNDDSLTFEQIPPLTYSIFCRPISKNLKTKNCYATIKPDSTFSLSLIPSTWDKIKFRKGDTYCKFLLNFEIAKLLSNINSDDSKTILKHFEFSLERI